MVNFLKNIFRPSSTSHSQRHRQSRPISSTPSANKPTTKRDEDDLQVLSDALQRELGQGRGKETEGTMRRLLEVLGDLKSNGQDGVSSQMASRGKTNSEAVSSESFGRGGSVKSGIMDATLQACTNVIDSLEACLQTTFGQDQISHLLGRLITSLEAQREEINEMKPYVEDRRFPSFVTLQNIYEKVDSEVKGIMGLSETAAQDALVTLVQVLREGPGYLIDICLISGIVWYAEIIDSGFAAAIRQILDSAIDEQSDLIMFRRSAETVVSRCATLSDDLLDDDEGKRAYTVITKLANQLSLRIATTRQATPITSLPSSMSGTPFSETAPEVTIIQAESPALSAEHTSTKISSADPDFKDMSIEDLQANYGTGISAPSIPLPGLSSFHPTSYESGTAPTPAPASPSVSATGSDSSQEVWEYRGQLLTRSALDLVLRQEALAQVDSSGQYAGDVSWDSLRNAWIPKWVQKLKVSDLAEGEVPDSNPANFEARETDEWGNQIGWYGVHKEMYYKKEPKWELQDG